MNPGNFSPYKNEKKIPDYATKDYVFCELCQWIERIPKLGENKHWRDLWPLSLEDIKEHGVETYEYHDDELRNEIIGKLKKDLPPEIGKAENILEQLHRAAESAGFHILSDDHCCQLLAWLLIYGGGNEQVVLDEALRTNIFEAQKRLNLYGSEVPNPELTIKLQEYITSIIDQDNPPDWVLSLEERHKIKSYRKVK